MEERAGIGCLYQWDVERAIAEGARLERVPAKAAVGRIGFAREIGRLWGDPRHLYQSWRLYSAPPRLAIAPALTWHIALQSALSRKIACPLLARSPFSRSGRERSV